MFTGIVEELGRVYRVAKQGNITLLEIKAGIVLEGVKIGDSVAVNGVCLTAIKKTYDFLSFEVMPESLDVSNLGFLRIGNKVNLERSLKAGDRISGHFVTGHILPILQFYADY